MATAKSNIGYLEARSKINEARGSSASSLNLTQLGLDDNQLAALLPEISRVTTLTDLSLDDNRLAVLPRGIFELHGLRHLSLKGNQLIVLPHEICKLTLLKELSLDGNRLTELPSEIGELSVLERLSLDRNQVSVLPPEIGNLTALTTLRAEYNQLTVLPQEIGNLTALRHLRLEDNHLAELPPEIGGLQSLTVLGLWGNELTLLPPEIGDLTALTTLGLWGNQLTELPSEIGELTALTKLYLQKNHLTALPYELGKLTGLTRLVLYENRLESPPPEIIEQGRTAVLAFLRETLHEDVCRQWTSKLMLVGEGGAGKTELLGRLLGKEFNRHQETTLGIDIVTLALDHPDCDNTKMELSAWDFGGQQIYHATHQFFLTNRSLFLLIWNARQGWEQGKLRQWLEQIKARAPESPILVVATHTDEREAVLPDVDLQDEYPQIAGFHSVSNKSGVGVEEFRVALTQVAADLPLMGEAWPANWVRAGDAVRVKKTEVESHISPKELSDILEANGVRGDAEDALLQWLHDLGEILFFHDNSDLNDKVFLDPKWVTERIYRVLDCKDVESGLGIFRRDHMDKLWPELDREMREYLLRLMEQFDLSYRTLDDEDISIVVERLSQNPASYEDSWNLIAEEPSCKEVAMRYRLSTIPAGIPTWFIARSHRFTTNTHWAYGALFKSDSHLGLIRSYPGQGGKYLTLAVRGPAPHNFFAVLRDGLEVTLSRYPGLEVKRMVPCPGHGAYPCAHEFDYSDLQRAISMAEPVRELQCQKSFQTVSTLQLLFGLDMCLTQDDVIIEVQKVYDANTALADKIDKLSNDERQRFEIQQASLRELLELSQRSFTAMQSEADTEFPRVFVLEPSEQTGWRRVLFGQKAKLHICCEAPGCWHLASGANYPVTIHAEWLQGIAPYIAKMTRLLKLGLPLIAPALGMNLGKGVNDALQHRIKMTEELLKVLPNVRADHVSRDAQTIAFYDDPEAAKGITWNVLRSLLEYANPDGDWGELSRVLTPEGHWLWLCPDHRKEYER